ncbi:MAG: hypothetical protein ACXAEU_15295 [Candidatus Hodarchaeales archaeon]|jgi:ferredoxin
MSGIDLTVKELIKLFNDKILELQEEPEFQWTANNLKYASDDSGLPRVKIVAGNVPLDYDLWKGLRNPAVVGLYPAGLQEIWEYQANKRRKSVDETGRRTIFQIPRSFDNARKDYRRSLLISVMLPFSSKVLAEYSKNVLDEEKSSSHLFSRMYEDLNLMINKATSRVAIDLVTSDNAVVSMNDANVNSVSTEAIPLTRQGVSHGPSKSNNYPQKSLAALLGLGQFGMSRIIFRDELVNDKVKRFAGPIRSIIVFDKQDLIRDGSGEIKYPTENWREFLFKLFDFTNIDPEINKYRFCTYFPQNGSGCGKCIDNCPSSALLNSVPEPDGNYSDRVANQTHRFWENKLQFDYGKCCDDRGQMMGLFPEWSCARCVIACTARGNKRKSAVKNYYEMMERLMAN